MSKIKLGDIAYLYKKNISPALLKEKTKYLGLEHFLVGGGISGFDYSDKVSSSQSEFHKSDILYGKLRPYFNKIFMPDFNGICSSEIWVIRTSDAGLVNPTFLYYSLFDSRFSIFVNSHSNGTRMPRGNWEQSSKYIINLPPLDEQVRIANVLSSLDNLIDNNKQQIQKTLELSRAYYDLIVKDVENTVELKTVAVFNKESTKKQDSGKVTYIEISNVKDGLIEWCDEIEWSQAATSARRLVSKGDTIWSNVRPNRRSHSLILDKPDNMVVTTGMTVISPAPEKIGAAFLFATLDSEAYSSYLAQHADGTTYPTVGEEHFANSVVAMPEQKEIDQFEENMLPLWEDAKRAEMDNIKLSKMRNELLPLLISGEITVKEAEEQIEG